MLSRACILLAICAVLMAQSPSIPAQSRRLAPADILKVATISDAQISPSGEWIVYSVAGADGNQTVSTLWLARVGERVGGNPTARQPEQRRNWEPGRTLSRPLLPAGWSASNPRWSPDSKSI